MAAIPIRQPSGFGRRKLTRGRMIALIIVLAAILVLLLSKGLAMFYTDWLWFDSVHLGQTWRGLVGAKVGLALVFIGVFIVICFANLMVADRSMPDIELAAAGPEDEFVRRYRATVGRYTRVIYAAVSLLLAIAVGAGAESQWNNWILFRNAVNFTNPGCRLPGYGKVCVDAEFHKPISFFVFKLPFIEFVIGWAFAALVVVTIATMLVHYLNGGIRFQAKGRRVGSQVKAHLSVLLALLALVKAAGYYFGRYQLDTSTRGFVEGASYTDVHAQLPAFNLLIWIMLVACVLFLVNIRRQGWVLPMTGIGLWLVVAVVLGAIYPALIQNFKVKPAQSVLERPYIKRDITATRFAMGINHVEVEPFNYQASLTTQEVTAYSTSLTDAQLWDPQFTLQAFDKLQDIRSYYQFKTLGVDRYPIGAEGQETPVILGVRQLNYSQLPSGGWVNTHLQYTHGYGVALAPANQVSPTATPNFVISDLPVSSMIPVNIDQPSVYFGTGMSGWVIVDSRQKELDFQNPSTGANVYSPPYSGDGGVKLSSLFRRLAFAIRFGDVNTLISSLVTDRSRVMFYRNVSEEVQKAAPFLQLDADPYPILMDGQIWWMQDAYTTTDQFPYSQPPDTSPLPESSGLANTSFNYVRNSVKILVNAYTGQMTFYVMDPNDPVIQAYERAFPGMFTPASKMALQHPDLPAHLRYPEDLMTVQAAAYGSYHITNVAGFYNQGDAWVISQDPGSGNPSQLLQPQTFTNSQGQLEVSNTVVRMPPVYQELQLPGSTQTSFTLMEPMVPYSANDQVQNLTSLIVGLSDPGQYGKLVAYVLPRGQLIDGPALVDATMAANPKISQEISLLNQQGSSVELGDVLPIPVGNSIVYVRPLYIESSRNPLPQLQYVVAVSGKTAVMDTSLAAALQDLTQSTLPVLGTQTPSSAPSPQVSAAVSQDLQQAQDAYNAAQQALSSGNLGAYQSDINQMEQYVSAAQQAAGGSGIVGSSSSTTVAPRTTGTTARGRTASAEPLRR
jgi:uncharacterized membrane protein (UPF0182 family)